MRWLLVFFLAVPAQAWDQHALLTASALRGEPGLNRMARVETLDDYLSATGGGNTQSFLKAQQLNPTVALKYRLGETAGSDVRIGDVIAGYADEPDNGELDQDLFTHYPQLWKPEYEAMTGRKGPQTRVFRHSFWPFGYFMPPTGAAKGPTLVLSALGEAPERAELFYQKSREAFAAGHPYWGARFLSWSLHYLGDLSQPFHTSQLPSTEFIQRRPDQTIDLDATVRTVAYYHLILDSYPAQAAQGNITPRMAQTTAQALSSGTLAGFVSARQLAKATAEKAARRSLATADALLDFFSPPSPADLADPLARVYDPALWAAVAAEAKARPQEAAACERLAAEFLSSFGAGARQLTQAALAARPAPAAKVPDAGPLLEGARRVGDSLLVR